MSTRVLAKEMGKFIYSSRQVVTIHQRKRRAFCVALGLYC